MAVTPHKASPKPPSQPTRKEAPFLELTLKGHESFVHDVAFIHGTRLLVTGSGDKSLRVWDLDTGKQVGEPLLGHDAIVRSVAASPDGRWIVSGGENGSILVWEVATNKREFKRVLVPFEGHAKGVWDVVFAPDSETFASASYDKTVCVWKRETGKIVLGPLKVDSEAFSVAYSPDGTKLAAGTDKHIIIWNTATGKELLKIKQRAWRISFTPDGLRLVSGNWNDIRISDATTGDVVKQFDAHTSTITEPFYSLAIAPNGTKFATTSHDKTTQFFDLTTFGPISEPLEHPDVVWGVAFSEDSQLIATVCQDKLVRTWTVPLSESEKESQQKILKILCFHARRFVLPLTSVLQKTVPGPQPRPRRAPIPTNTSNSFFGDFDPHSPPGRNNRTATATRHAEGFKIKNMMDRLFSRSSAPQGHAPQSRSIPLVDVFATRGKYCTANAQSGKRHLARPLHPPHWQAHASASSSSTPPAGTSNVVDATTPATLQTGSANASATANHPSPLDVEHVPDVGCFAVLTRCFPCLSQTLRTSPAAPRTS